MSRLFPISILLLFLSIIISGCGLLGIGGGDEEVPEEEALAQQETAIPTTDPSGGYATRRQFFEMKKDVTSIKTELARIKSDIASYSAKPVNVTGTEPNFGFLETKEITHQVTLNNGTRVLGKITRERLDDIVIVTQIGTLTIDRRQISDIAPAESPKANCRLVEDPGSLEQRVYPDRRVFNGTVKNIGERRADFVIVRVKISDETTRIIATDSAYVSGEYFKFSTGVISDTSILPEGYAKFSLTVYLPPDAEISYYTTEIDWKEYE